MARVTIRTIENMKLDPSFTVVPPQHFAETMEQHWVSKLGNKSSPKLTDVWQVMGMEFASALYDSAKQDQDRKHWRILQPPTGSGKTQGTAVYCSLVAEHNEMFPRKIGVLLVVRLIEQARDMVRSINELVGREIAFAHHSELPLSPETMRKADVLVITQAALVKAFEGLTKNTFNRWHEFAHWEHGKRNLIIIDEALTGVVEENKITLEGLRMALGAIPEQIRKEHIDAIDALQMLERLLFDMSDGAHHRDKLIWATPPKQIDLGPLRVAMSKLPLDKAFMGKESDSDRKRLRSVIDNHLRDAQAILDRWAVYSKKGTLHTLNSALLLIPDDAPPAVVLDATASQSELWEILGDRARIAVTPADARNYRNVTLHVCRAKGMGKHKMRELAQDRFPRLLENLEQRVGPDKKVFVCTHLAAEHVALSFEPNFASYAVGHWGAIDGRNDWQEFDTAVIFGLPYRDTVWANNHFFAVHGPKENEWFDSPKWGDHEDVRLMMQQRQLSVSVIQAINRVRCRRVVNGQGDCGPTDVFIVLPPDSVGEAVLGAIKTEMPNIKVVDWAFEPDGPQVKVRKGSHHEAVLSLMDQRRPGETSMSFIKAELRLTDSGVKELRRTLRDNSHPLTGELAKRRVRYRVDGVGRGSRSYLVKAA
jgi:hypothetical protein